MRESLKRPVVIRACPRCGIALSGSDFSVVIYAMIKNKKSKRDNGVFVLNGSAVSEGLKRAEIFVLCPYCDSEVSNNVRIK